MGSAGVWIAGSYQSDYARNYAREGLEISDMVAEAVTGILDSAGLSANDVDAIHVGNAFGQLFTGQGQLGAMPATVEPALQAKFDRSQGQPYVFPHVRQVVKDAFRRARLADVTILDGIETHDCFSMSEYMAIDHFGITGPGESWKAVENGDLERDGAIPVNPSGGLIGVGHPVDASGVRMLRDAALQVTGQAGDTQVDNARTFATLNIGGSLTTTVSFVVTRED
jgi:acetyl-CoA acetyltransferase